jgi:hypothetical protein
MNDVLTATALVTSVGDVQRFPSARHFASYLGLTPREHSTGARRRLGAISKRGDTYLRMLLIHGARAVLCHAKTKTAPAPDRTDPLFDVPDLPGRLGEGRSEQAGHARVGVFEHRPDVRYDLARADGDDDAELAQQPPHGVDARGVRGEPGGAQAMQGGQGLLGVRLHGHGPDVFVTRGLKQPLRVRAVRLIAEDVRPHHVWRHESDPVPVGLGVASPVVGRPAGFHQHRRRRLLSDELVEPRPREPMSLPDAAGVLGDGHLEDGLGDFDRDRRRMHGGLLLPRDVDARRLWHVDAAQVAGGVHSINAMQPTVSGVTPIAERQQAAHRPAHG